MRFQIRTLMFVVTAFAIMFSIAETLTRDSRIRRRIESDLRSMGAYKVSFDGSNLPSWVSFVTPVGLDRIRDYESFENLEFATTNVTDDIVRELSHLKYVRALYFTECNVTDAQLEILASIGSVSKLQISGAPITDDALPAIASIRGLESLSIGGTLITAGGVAALRQLHPQIRFGGVP